jgi:hypothetical protein
LNWDEDPKPFLIDALNVTNEAEPECIMIPVAVDARMLQINWGVPALPAGGLPHVEPRRAVEVDRCEWWPDIGKRGAWIPHCVVARWELIREVAKSRGLELPEGSPIFVCDWD